MPVSSDRHSFLLEIAAEAASVARSHFSAGSGPAIVWKGKQDPLTEADLAIEFLIKEAIHRNFPDDHVLGEEGGGTRSDRFWAIDPIDGTANFGRGIPHFGISIAFVDAAGPQLAAVFAPMQDERFTAERGTGAYLNGRRLHVSGGASLEHALIEVGWNLKDRVPAYMTTIAKLAAQGAGLIRAGSAAVALAYVAAGRLDAYVEQYVYAWDALAGVLLVHEAGGRTNDFYTALDIHHGAPILAATPALYEQVRAAAHLP